MYKLVKTQYSADGTRASSMVEYATKNEAKSVMHRELGCAYSQKFAVRIIILGEIGEYISNEFADGR